MDNWKALAEKLLFDFGKAVLGSNSGGTIVKLIKMHGVAGARDRIAAAASKQNPREYLGAIMNGHSNRPEANLVIGERIGKHEWTGSRWREIE